MFSADASYFKMCDAPVQTMSAKDPSVHGNVRYDIPLQYFERTQGFKEHMSFLLNAGKRPPHKPCLCRLHLEGKCGQGERCKSLHVDSAWVETARAERGVVVDGSFLNEIVVQVQGLPPGVLEGELGVPHTTFAVRFPAVLRTAGLQAYKKHCSASPDAPVRPFPLCPGYLPCFSGREPTCTMGKSCRYIHVAKEELSTLSLKRLRTPCCGVHGDDYPGSDVKLCVGRVAVPAGRVCATRGLRHALARVCIGPGDVCTPHIVSRCKFGRSCGKVHVCRSWAAEVGLLSRGASSPPPPLPLPLEVPIPPVPNPFLPQPCDPAPGYLTPASLQRCSPPPLVYCFSPGGDTSTATDPSSVGPSSARSSKKGDVEGKAPPDLTFTLEELQDLDLLRPDSFDIPRWDHDKGYEITL